MSSSQPRHFAVVVPVKPSAVAKSRLAEIGPQTRADLVAGFAADTVNAALACPLVDLVLVVTDDHVLAAALRTLGCDVIPDGVAGDLNGTLVQAAAEARRRRPDLGVAALCADLPTLVPGDLATALRAAPDDGAAFVSDHAGTGTTMLVASGTEHFRPVFGHDSRAGHLDVGAVELTGDLETLRRDVDTVEDLAAALRLGVGDNTRRITDGLRL